MRRADADAAAAAVPAAAELLPFVSERNREYSAENAASLAATADLSPWPASSCVDWSCAVGRGSEPGNERSLGEEEDAASAARRSRRRALSPTSSSSTTSHPPKPQPQSPIFSAAEARTIASPPRSSAVGAPARDGGE